MNGLFKVTTKTIVAAGLGAAFFMLLFMFKIPSWVPETQFQIAYGLSAFFGVLFGPITAFLMAFIGHALSDFLQYGTPWWSWVIASGIASFVFGLAYKHTRVDEGTFGLKDILTFNLYQIAGNILAWLVVAPVLDILIYAEPTNKVFVLGAETAVMNIISAGLIGTFLLVMYSSTRTKKGSLSTEITQKELDNAEWVDSPDCGFMASKWGWGHTIVFVIAILLYVFPAIIFLIWKVIAGEVYNKKKEVAERMQNIAIGKTGDRYMSSMLHLGGHPLLPVNQRVVIGLDEELIKFYDYRLNMLHNISSSEVVVTTDIRNIQSRTIGTTYTPTNSSFGTTVSTQNIQLRPDTIKMGMVISGVQLVAEFDARPYNAMDFLTLVNKQKTRNL